MKAKNNTRAILLVPAAIALSPALAIAGSDAKEIIPETPVAASLWEFRAEPYGWLTGLDGTTSVGGITTDIDAPFFNDILDNLKMAAALQLEARYNKKWGLLVDGFYADLGSSGSTPGPLYNSVSVDLKQFIGQASISYRIYETPKGFVDLFAGARYNYMGIDIGAAINSGGVQTISSNSSSKITNDIDAGAKAIVDPRIAEYQAAAASDRAIIESEVSQTIQSDAKMAVGDTLKRQLVEIRRGNRLAPTTLRLDQLLANTARESEAVAEATAQLKVAELRASVDSTLQGDVVKAQRQVAKADKKLANAINTSLKNSLPTDVSDNKQWVDPIVGLRAQYNFNDRWYLAGNTDIGGFGVSSELTWSIEATVGYNFSERISTELGYRFLYTDYTSGKFGYDMKQAGIYTGVNFRF